MLNTVLVSNTNKQWVERCYFEKYPIIYFVYQLYNIREEEITEEYFMFSF